MSVGDPKAAEEAFKKAFADTRSPEQKAADAAREQAEIWEKANAEAARKAAEAAGRAAAINKGMTSSPGPRAEMGGKRRLPPHRVTAKRFCSCVKKVKSAKKKRTEGSSIAICTSSLLWPHGRTLHSVSCRRKNHLKTQKRSTLRKK